MLNLTKFIRSDAGFDINIIKISHWLGNINIALYSESFKGAPILDIRVTMYKECIKLIQIVYKT